MNETPSKPRSEYLRGFYAAQDFSSGVGSEPSREDQEEPDFASGWNTFFKLREMYVNAGFIEKDGVFTRTFSTGEK